MPDLKIYNSLTRQKETFQPLNKGQVTMYACGPTVYSYAHIGNARMAVIFDVWARLLRLLYPKVTYVSNITDIEDKIINAARETGEAIDVITRKYTQIYNEDMAVLGVQVPDIQPLATEHVQEMIDQISSLIARGHAYAADGHVLFDVPSAPAYGALSGRSRDEQIAGARVDVAPYKKDPADFVLWKPSSGDEPGWDSPWGFGRPGWHIECSAMAEKYLGLPFDIHGGGADLKFPHHENEIAQSCCAHGNENDPAAFARYWIHNGFLTVEGEKMSKSLGNFLLVHDLIQQYPGEVLRLTFLSSHYRQPLDWAESTIQQNKRLLDRLYQKLKELEDVDVPDDVAVPSAVLEALCDDLNVPHALAVLSGMIKDEKDPAVLKAAIKGTGSIIGILEQAPDAWLGYGQGEGVPEIERLLVERTQAKKDKNFARADAIRDELMAQGVVIEDTPAGPKWKRVS